MGLKLMERMPSGAFDEREPDESTVILRRFWEEAERVVTASRAPAPVDRRGAAAAMPAKSVKYGYD
jgi:hypothetical protein